MKLSYLIEATVLKDVTWKEKRIFCLLHLEQEGIRVSASREDYQRMMMVTYEEMHESKTNILVHKMKNCIANVLRETS